LRKGEITMDKTNAEKEISDLFDEPQEDRDSFQEKHDDLDICW
jgi:hypothetical protein